MTDDEFEKRVDWLVKHGMTFHKAMILTSYCETQNVSLPRGYVDLVKARDEADPSKEKIESLE